MSVFEAWKAQANQYIQKHIDRKPFTSIADALDGYIAELSELYTAILLENHLIDQHGDDTGLDFDEDDLIDAMLARFLASHGGDDERELLYATLIDTYLTLVEECSEDI